MSRYTEGDLKGLTKPALLQLVLRQPSVTIPRKLSTQPVTSLTKDKLRKLLAGPFGFVKEEPIMLPEQDNVSMQGQMGRAEKEEEETSNQSQQIQEDDLMREEVFAEAEPKSDQPEGNGMLEETTETAQLVKTLPRDLVLDTSAPKPLDLPTTSFDHSSGNYSIAQHDTPSANEVPQVQVAAAVTITKQELDSLIRMDEQKEVGKLPSSLCEIVASFPLEVSMAVAQYFMCQSEEMKAWESIDFAHKKKKPDFAVVGYIRQVLALHDRLKRHPWPTDTGTLRTKDLAKILGFCPSWFTNARHILEEYNKVGPESGRTNGAILARFQEKGANKKSGDLLSFLRAQREIIEREAIL